MNICGYCACPFPEGMKGPHLCEVAVLKQRIENLERNVDARTTKPPSPEEARLRAQVSELQAANSRAQQGRRDAEELAARKVAQLERVLELEDGGAAVMLQGENDKLVEQLKAQAKNLQYLQKRFEMMQKGFEMMADKPFIAPETKLAAEIDRVKMEIKPFVDQATKHLKKELDAAASQILDLRQQLLALYAEACPNWATDGRFESMSANVRRRRDELEGAARRNHQDALHWRDQSAKKYTLIQAAITSLAVVVDSAEGKSLWVNNNVDALGRYAAAAATTIADLRETWRRMTEHAAEREQVITDLGGRKGYADLKNEAEYQKKLAREACGILDKIREVLS